MKEQLYELVTTNDPNNKIFVLDINDQTSASDIEFVIGIGAIEKISKVGYKGIEIRNLFEDLIFDKYSEYNPEYIVQETLPTLKKGNIKYVPIFKYLNAAGYLDDETHYSRLNSSLKELADNISSGGISYFSSTVKSYIKKQPEIQDMGSIAKLCEKYDNVHVMNYILLLRLEQISISELREFLRNNFDLLKSDDTNYRSSFRRLACLYDWLYFYYISEAKTEERS